MVEVCAVRMMLYEGYKAADELVGVGQKSNRQKNIILIAIKEMHNITVSCH